MRLLRQLQTYRLSLASAVRTCLCPNIHYCTFYLRVQSLWIFVHTRPFAARLALHLDPPMTRYVLT